MTSPFKILVIFITTCILTNCSQLLETVDLEINTEDTSLQEEFNVVEKVLTIKEARKQRTLPILA